MNTKRSAVLIVISLLICQAVLAQNKPKPEMVSEKIMNTEFQSLDNSAPIRLTDYKGRIVVLVVWASWCAPCRQAVISLNDLNKESTYRRVEVIGLSIDDPKPEAENVQSFLHDAKLDYKLGWIKEETAKELLTGEGSIPQIFVLTDGLIVTRFRGFSQTTTIEKLHKSIEQAYTNPPTKQ